MTRTKEKLTGPKPTVVHAGKPYKNPLVKAISDNATYVNVFEFDSDNGVSTETATGTANRFRR